METIFLIVLAAFNVWTIYFYNKLLLEVANGKEKEKKPPIDPMALVGKSLFKVSQLRKKGETEQKQTESMSVSDNDVTYVTKRNKHDNGNYILDSLGCIQCLDYLFLQQVAP